MANGELLRVAAAKCGEEASFRRSARKLFYVNPPLGMGGAWRMRARGGRLRGIDMGHWPSLLGRVEWGCELNSRFP
jgi:hypothetical protein